MGHHLTEILNYYKDIWVTGTIKYVCYNRDFEDNLSLLFGQFARLETNIFDRHHYPGHFTASALVTNFDFSRVLLTLHRKLGFWLQLGGHADGQHDLVKVATQEVYEEAGLVSIKFVPYHRYLSSNIAHFDAVLPFDLDRHEIPAHHHEPAHWHYDVRYLVTVDDKQPIKISDESIDLRWFDLSEARTVASQPSMIRQFDKLEAIRDLRMAHGARYRQKDVVTQPSF